jgi:hypothetical protein
MAFNTAPDIRPSQNGATGVAADGSSLTGPATKQYETCLRCHGNSSGKQILPEYGYLPTRAVFGGDPWNLIPQFGATAVSVHPVMRDATGISQPSLLTAMWDIYGKVQTRPMGTRIFCTDCHNSDDNREFGGTGPVGPHGSKWDHILERRYEFSQASAPGQSITNLFPSPDLSANGPYALCGKCHDLSNILQNTSFAEHARHINAGFSCSVCHTAHGVGSVSSNSSGQRLVNFDMNVVAPNGGSPVSYNRGSNTCTLTCHNEGHD